MNIELIEEIKMYLESEVNQTIKPFNANFLLQKINNMGPQPKISPELLEEIKWDLVFTDLDKMIDSYKMKLYEGARDEKIIKNEYSLIISLLKALKESKGSE